jgi:hypothetical protein
MIEGVIEAFAEFLNGQKRGIDLAALDKAYPMEIQFEETAFNASFPKVMGPKKDPLVICRIYRFRYRYNNTIHALYCFRLSG